jgi:hypothetical protein
MSFSASYLIAGFIFGVVGFYLFREGKRRLNYQILFIGVGLMVYPLFVTNDWMIWIVGAGLCGLAYYVW